MGVLVLGSGVAGASFSPSAETFFFAEPKNDATVRCSGCFRLIYVCASVCLFICVCVFWRQKIDYRLRRRFGRFQFEIFHDKVCHRNLSVVSFHFILKMGKKVRKKFGKRRGTDIGRDKEDFETHTQTDTQTQTRT